MILHGGAWVTQLWAMIGYTRLALISLRKKAVIGQSQALINPRKRRDRLNDGGRNPGDEGKDLEYEPDHAGDDELLGGDD